MDLLAPTSVAALLISVLLTLLLIAQRRRAGAGRAADRDFLDTVQAWPPQAVRVMTLPERLAYGTLCRALPKHMVLAQVPLSRFISVPPSNSHAQWLSRVGRLSVDLLVCDTSSRVVAAIEVRAPTLTARSVSRHERVIKVLQAAGVKVFVWSESDLPGVAEVRALFKRKGDGPEAEPEPDAIDRGGRHRIPVPEIQELVMEGGAFGYNPSNEPVSSDFFDDLDAFQPHLHRA